MAVPETNDRRPSGGKSLTVPVPSRTSVWFVIWMWIPTATILVSVPVLLLVVFVAWPPVSYESQGKLQGVVNLSDPHRAALRAACENGSLRAGLTNEYLGLAASKAYESEFTHSVTSRATGTKVARVEILLKRINNDIRDGETVVLEGRCADARMRWKVSGDIPGKYLEHLTRVIEKRIGQSRI